MALQRIDRDNGSFYVGNYETVIDRHETDCDRMGPDGRVAGGRFRYSFELYEGVRWTPKAGQAAGRF